MSALERSERRRTPLAQALKKIRWVYRLNANWKAAALKRRYNSALSYYARRTLSSDFRRLLEGRAGPRLARLGDIGRLHIFFLGTDALQDKSGILQALGRCGEMVHFTRADGSYGQYTHDSESERRRANTERLWALFASLHASGKTPNLLIAQTWAGFVNPEVFGRIAGEYGTVVVNIGMDDRHQYWGRKVNGEWRGTRGLIPYIDLALSAAPECVEWYLKESCPALFFPEASDPQIFRPIPGLQKEHDICFVGARYGVRERIVTDLRRAGVRVSAFGQGWEGGRIGVEDVPRLFAQSKIVLGVGTVGHCSDFYALKMRDFDGPMSGSFYLTHDNPDLYRLYDIGNEIATYRTVEECVNRVRYYLEHDKEREDIARRGRERAVREHTWDKRFSDLIALLTRGLPTN